MINNVTLACEDASDILRLGQSVLKQADLHSAPPYPKVYDVFYWYLSGGYPDLSSAVDEVIKGGGKLDLDRIARIHDTFLSDGKLAGEISDIGDKLEYSIDGIQDAINLGVDSGTSFRDDIGALADRLDDTTDLAECRRLAENLKSKSSGHLDALLGMTHELNRQVHEIAALKEEIKALRDQALLDHLTQVYNRRSFEIALEREIAASFKTQSPLSIVICDIDHFKSFNDRHGHPAGDRLLKKVADVFKKNTKRKDIVARIGGEEFAIILPATSEKGAVALSEYLREYIQALRLVDTKRSGHLSKITASFGVSVLQPEDTTQSFVERADVFLYAAKKAGRNRVVFKD